MSHFPVFHSKLAAHANHSLKHYLGDEARRPRVRRSAAPAPPPCSRVVSAVGPEGAEARLRACLSVLVPVQNMANYSIDGEHFVPCPAGSSDEACPKIGPFQATLAAGLPEGETQQTLSFSNPS